MKKIMIIFVIINMLFVVIGCKHSDDIIQTGEITKEENLILSTEENYNITYSKFDNSIKFSQKINESSIKLDSFYSERFTSSITEDNNNIYFALKDGIYKEDKVSKLQIKLFDVESAYSLSVYSDSIYFVVKGSGQNEKICKIDKNGQNYSTVFRGEFYLGDYVIYKNDLYFQDSTQLFFYNKDKNSVEVLIDDVNSFQIKDDKIYYLDHASESFTIYEYDLENRKNKIVLGKGQSRPKEDIYKEFLWIDNVLYIYKRMPAGLFKYVDGKEILIDDGNVCNLINYKNDLCYIVNNGFKTYLYKYNGEKISLEACMYYLNKNAGVSVVNDYVYYNSGVKIESRNGNIIENYSESLPCSISLNGEKNE